MSETFTLEQVEKLVGQAMKIESPLGQKILAEFKNTPPDVEAKQILDNMNYKRFEASGYVHNIQGELALELDIALDEQCTKQFMRECGEDSMPLDSKDIFQLGYRIGMGAVPLGRLV